MVIDTLKRFVAFVALCLAQALVLNHIHLFNVMTPLLYVYFVIAFPRNYPKWAILLWSFFLGLCIDMLSNTPGMASGALTLVGAIQPYLMELFVPRDSIENLKCSAHTLGWAKFSLLAFLLTFILCLAFFTLEMFSFFNWQHWLLCISTSTVLTLVIILALENFRTES